MRIWRGGWRCLATVLLALLTGCAGSPVTPTYYRMAVEEAAQASATPAFPVIGVWPVQLPDYLDRSGVVTYGLGLEVKIASLHQWAGGLQSNTTRVLHMVLGQHLGRNRLEALPVAGSRPDYVLQVTLEELGGPLRGTVTLIGRWELRAYRGEAVRKGQAHLTLDGGDYADYVAAINRLVVRFAEELAEELQAWLVTPAAGAAIRRGLG